MPQAADQVSETTKRANRRLAVLCVAFFAGMVGMAYAAVPLYDMFCRVTGYGGTTQRVTQYSDRVLDRTITIRFDANVSGGLPWDFKPGERSMTIRIGETAQAFYRAENRFGTPSAGRATFNVSPGLAGAYFNKVECFCFTDTTLKPGEALDMPVVFYIDPDIENVRELADVNTITLSYTFFPLAADGDVAAAPSTGAGEDRNTGG